MRPAGSALGIFRSQDPDLCVLGRRILCPREPCIYIYIYIYIYSRLSLSRTPRDSMKQIEISVLRHIRFADSGKQLIKQPPLTE